MTTMTMFEAAIVLKDAGFDRAGAGAMLAIGIAESGLDITAVNTAGNHPPSRDRGWLQLNDYWHPEVTDAQAFDPDTAAAAALRISEHGKNFTPWTTWDSGAASRHLLHARQVIAVVFDGSGIALRRVLRLQSPPLPFLHGHDVAVVQHLLGVTADGVYGPVTAEAVRHFQTVEGITADDIVGPITARRIGCVWAPPTP